jgi:dipeptidyl aminopeptidase/acylaminoacyl peptidase
MTSTFRTMTVAARGFAVVVLAAFVLLAILLLIRNGSALIQRRKPIVASLPAEVPTSSFAREKMQVTSAADKFPYGMAKMTFERGRGIYVYDLFKGQSKRIADGYEPRISPAGDLIAFTNGGDSLPLTNGLRLFDLKNNRLDEIPALHGLRTRSPSWSSDGQKLAFDVVIDKRSHVAILDLRSGQWNDITKNFQFLDRVGLYASSWSPASMSIICHDLSSIYEISEAGTVLRTLSMTTVVPAGEVASDIRFQLSSDGKRVLFGTRMPDHSAIYVFDILEGTRRDVTPKGFNVFDPIWLSDQTILFSCAPSEATNRESDICLMSLSDRNVVKVLARGENASYSSR